jgi:hypothetical protein
VSDFPNLSFIVTLRQSSKNMNSRIRMSNKRTLRAYKKIDATTPTLFGRGIGTEFNKTDTQQISGAKNATTRGAPPPGGVSYCPQLGHLSPFFVQTTRGSKASCIADTASENANKNIRWPQRSGGPVAHLLLPTPLRFFYHLPKSAQGMRRQVLQGF